MKRDMMEELATRIAARVIPPVSGKPEPDPDKQGLRTKEWNRRKARNKMARQSRKLNRRGA